MKNALPSGAFTASLPDRQVISAPVLTVGKVLSSWSIQPVAIVVAIAAVLWYLSRVGRVRTAGGHWSNGRTASWLIGVAALLIVCCGPAAYYGRSIFWIFVSQALALLLVVPVGFMAGQPVDLLRTLDPHGLVPRIVDSRVGGWLSSPLVGPALVPVVCVFALFGPVPGFAAGSQYVGWLIQLLLLLIGAVMVLPLVATGDTASSVAVGAAVAVGFVELLIDAVPGIVLRLSTNPITTFFTHRTPITGAPAWLHDQQIGGGVLWCVAELLDLPFLALVFGRWVRADAREAAQVDAELDSSDTTDVGGPDEPWFLQDPRLKDRLR